LEMVGASTACEVPLFANSFDGSGNKLSSDLCNPPISCDTTFVEETAEIEDVSPKVVNELLLS